LCLSLAGGNELTPFRVEILTLEPFN